MIRIARMLLWPLVGLSAVLLLAVGLTIGLVGIAVRLSTGSDRLVAAGAGLMRAVEDLPRPTFGLGRTFVYFIRDTAGATKIGISGDPVQRVLTLQTGHPDELYLYRSLRCRTSTDARAVEGDLHALFERNRMNGEWFDLSERQLRRAIRLARRWR